MNSGIDSTNNPMMEIHHRVFRPTLSDHAPKNGTKSIMAVCPMMIRMSDARDDRPISPSR
jgi:hypothetical protein